ncbi:MAG: SigE family RNA polymerase sigma factor [Sporichthyaceae bacterium]
MGRGSEDDAEFVAFVVSAQPRLTRIAYLMGGDWQQAEDVVQTVLVRLYPKFAKVAAGGDPFGYVRAGLLNAVIDERRRPWRRERSVPDFAEDAIGSVQGVDAADAVAALAQIPARQRAVVVLRYLEGLSVAEVAHELGISEGTVKSQAARGIAAVRAALREGDERDGVWPARKLADSSEKPKRSKAEQEAADV